jgi:RNA polymerase sigma-70 factor (sigma-E family)
VTESVAYPASEAFSYEERFDAVYRREHPRLVRLAHLITGSNGAAEELVHDVFVAAYRRWRHIDDPAGYLYRGVVNRSRSFLRRRRLEARHRPHRPDVVLPPEIDEVWEALGRLPSRRRTALVLRYYADLSVDEIAASMGCRPATVRSLLHRGRQSLREELGE